MMRISLLVATVATVLTIAGCGGDGRPPLAAAGGKVTLDGEPVDGATVSFVPVDGGRPATAITDAEGLFTINAFTDAEGVAVGEHYVSVMKVGGKGADMLAAESTEEPAEDDDDSGADSLSPNAGGALGDEDDDSVVDVESLTEYLVPKEYMDAKTSGIKLTVPPEGSSELNIILFK